MDKEYFKFDDKQRRTFMTNYFKKYFKKDARKLPSRIEKFIIKADAINRNRECSCQFKPA